MGNGHVSLSMCIVNEIGGFNFDKMVKKLPTLSASKITSYYGI